MNLEANTIGHDAGIRNQLANLDKFGRIIGFPVHIFYETTALPAVGALTISGVLDAATYGAAYNQLDKALESPVFLPAVGLLTIASLASLTSFVGTCHRFYNRFYQGFFEIK